MENLEEKIKELDKQNKYLLSKIELYENGDDSLYHAVKRKMSEFAIILNKNSMQNIDLDDKNSKAFERITAILEKCEKIAISASALGVRSGAEQITTTANQFLTKKPFTPEMVADQVGQLAGQTT